ncbi:hypothetical protein Dimus_031989 [Dionaea muscipula]
MDLKEELHESQLRLSEADDTIESLHYEINDLEGQWMSRSEFLDRELKKVRTIMISYTLIEDTSTSSSDKRIEDPSPIVLENPLTPVIVRYATGVEEDRTRLVSRDRCTTRDAVFNAYAAISITAAASLVLLHAVAACDGEDGSRPLLDRAWYGARCFYCRAVIVGHCSRSRSSGSLVAVSESRVAARPRPRCRLTVLGERRRRLLACTALVVAYAGYGSPLRALSLLSHVHAVPRAAGGWSLIALRLSRSRLQGGRGEVIGGGG